MKQKKGKALLFALVLLVSLIPQVCPVRAAGDVAINPTNFPDANFRNYVKGFDSNNNDLLDVEELNNTTELNCSGRDIISITGIEHFSELQKLNCSNNKLYTLDLSHNTLLQHLDCRNNRLSALDLSHNTALLAAHTFYVEQITTTLRV